MDILQAKGQRFVRTGQIASGSAIAVEAASSGRTHYITDISASSNNSTSVVEIFSNTTVFWQSEVQSEVYIKEFRVPVAITTGSAVTLRCATANVIFVNMAGYTI